MGKNGQLVAYCGLKDKFGSDKIPFFAAGFKQAFPLDGSRYNRLWSAYRFLRLTPR